MDEREFRRVLNLFPVVRSRNYCGDSDLQDKSTSNTAEVESDKWQNAWAEADQAESNDEDPFWQKLKVAVQMKVVGPAEAERFCKAFQRVHRKLLSEEANVDAIRRFLGAAGRAGSVRP